jgi:4-hydroxythreonine-4-phosphate dehydrogenase
MAIRLAITLGDPAGIGPEVALKALAAEWSADDTRFILIGDPAQMAELNSRLRLGLDLNDARLVVQPPDVAVPKVSRSPEGARFAHACLETAAQLCIRGEHSRKGVSRLELLNPERRLQAASGGRGLHALPPEGGVPKQVQAEVAGVVTAPVNKEAIIRAGLPFVGQTEFFTERAGVNRTVMMLLGPDDRNRWLRVALATVHIALREVPVKLTPDKVLLAIERAAEACELLGLPRRRVAVCGLNPHAGEGGEFGDEESRVIDPAIQQARADGLDVVGPLSGDTVFHHALHGVYDAVVAMYHDQGLAPLKLAAFDKGVNWTLGLPFIRTSPDHGTAYDLAGQGKANPSSMIEAIRLAKQLARTRTDS